MIVAYASLSGEAHNLGNPCGEIGCLRPFLTADAALRAHKPLVKPCSNRDLN